MQLSFSDFNGSTRWPVSEQMSPFAGTLNQKIDQRRCKADFLLELTPAAPKWNNSVTEAAGSYIESVNLRGLAFARTLLKASLLTSSASAGFGNFKITPITSPVYTSFLFRVQQAMGNFFNKMADSVIETTLQI
ncbi:hypothetical protein T12_6332 [Trichinella patagoniensis]|uniref:Uncharacterized protein n=1 Tax=Trichinella patagoniensis TaxID=990121 RepID=A0A0V0ZTQ2_9BILA|nr:hypothetical protein T12_6332 [Trichinella patagoniensis]